jgi:hypothetical protein
MVDTQFSHRNHVAVLPAGEDHHVVISIVVHGIDLSAYRIDRCTADIFEPG